LNSLLIGDAFYAVGGYTAGHPGTNPRIANSHTNCLSSDCWSAPLWSRSWRAGCYFGRR